MPYYLYHIHTDGMGLESGYVGITVDPRKRWARHKSSTSDSSEKLKRAIRKYKPKFSIIGVYDTLEEVLWMELVLRPFDNIGWNIVKGGGLPPYQSGETHSCYGIRASKETRLKQSLARKGRYGGHKHPSAKPINVYDYKTGNLLAENVVSKVWAKENGYHQAHLSATASGKMKQHKGIYARYCND